MFVRNLDLNGADDIVAWDETNNSIVVALGDETGSYLSTSHAITATITDVHLLDDDADGDIDIEVTTTGGTTTLTNDGTGSFS